MLETCFRTVAAALAAAAVALAPGAAAAQTSKVGGVTPEAALSAQEREMVALAGEFARRVTETVDRWVATKEISADRLFSALYYPVPNTDPPKFTTDYDKLADREGAGGFVDIQEAILARAPNVIVYTVTVDRNGYLPTHNRRYSMPLTGNPAADLVNNRTKRIFNDKTGLAAAQNTAPFLVQNYQRDTGETMADVSVPITIQGKHWGAVRIGYRRVETAAR